MIEFRTTRVGLTPRHPDGSWRARRQAVRDKHLAALSGGYQVIIAVDADRAIDPVTNPSGSGS